MKLAPRETMEFLSFGSFKSKLENFFGRYGLGKCELLGSIRSYLGEVQRVWIQRRSAQDGFF